MYQLLKSKQASGYINLDEWVERSANISFHLNDKTMYSVYFGDYAVGNSPRRRFLVGVVDTGLASPLWYLSNKDYPYGNYNT